jgi:hypothetical protein
MNKNNEKDHTKKTQLLITQFFKPIIKEEIKTSHYHCLECGVDMGDYPGQLCRKWYCDGTISYNDLL